MALVGGVTVLALVAGSLGAAIGVSLASKHGSDSPAVTPATAPSGGATTTPIPSPGSGTPGTTAPASGSSAAPLVGAALDVKGILAKVEPSVVDIVAQSRRETGEGTGIIISPDGYILTNAHVVSGASTVTVSTSSSGKALSATVIGADTAHDVALIKVDNPGGSLAAADLGRSADVKVGDDVVAIGNALALDGGPTVTQGIVSALDRTISAGDQGSSGTSETLRHVLQTDAAINPGNSGGPLLNAAGEVVGINTAVAGDAQNIGFALAIDKALPIINTLKTGQTPEQPFLGLSTVTLTPGIQRQLGLDVSKGAVVASVTPGSGAELAGLAQGDVITRVDGRDVQSADDVSAAVGDHKPGDQIDITVDRGGSTRTVTAKIGRRAGGGG